MPKRRATATASSATPLACSCSAGCLACMVRMSTSRAWSRGAGGAAVLVRVHALVGELQGVIEGVGLVRQQNDAVGRRVIAKLLAASR